MGPGLPQLKPNIVTNTKNPLCILSTGKRDCNRIENCLELKDGRIIVNVSYQYILVYNLLNPTLIDIKIDCDTLKISSGFNIMQLDDGTLIFAGVSPYIRLVQIESKSFKIINTINMDLYLVRCHVDACCKLSNGQLVFSLETHGYETIALFGYDVNAKNLIYYYNFAISGYSIYKIIECKNNELFFHRGSTQETGFTFFNLKEQKEVFSMKARNSCEPIKLNENFILFSNSENIEIINLDDHTIYRTISLANLGYNYSINCFLKFDENTLFIGDEVGNIYLFSINWNDTNVLNFVEVFMAADTGIIILSKYQGNKLISVSEFKETINIWDYSFLKNNNYNLSGNYY